MYVVDASPGLGYSFRLHSKSPDTPDNEAFSGRRSVELEVQPGGKPHALEAAWFLRRRVGVVPRTHAT